MSRVMHTVNVVYGSYSQDGVEVTCDEDDDTPFITAKVKRELQLNFLPMAYCNVKITDTKYLNDESD